MSSNADFFRPSKLTNYHCCGCEIILDEKIEIFKILEKYGKKHDSNPNLCHCASRSGIVKNEKLSSISIPQKKHTTRTSSLRIGQGSASYCKKIFTRAAFPFFAAWCRTGSRSPFKSFFLRSLGAKIQPTFRSFEEVSALPKLGTNLINYAAYVGLVTLSDYNLQASRAFSGR